MERRLKAAESAHPARWWQAASEPSGARTGLHCRLCPHECTLADGERGACYVRRNIDGRMVSTTYGRASGFRIAAIEAVPFYHFHPGSPTLSFATAGCNLACAYCANGDAQHAADADRRSDTASPEGIARAARAYGARLLAFCDSDPVAFAEYAIDTAVACREHGIKAVAATAGYIQTSAARELFAALDAVNVGVKGFCDAAYARLCGGHLAPVLDTLCQLRFETRCWLEISYALVPGYNDSSAEIGALATWIARELGTDVPLHIAWFAFKHPAGEATACASTNARLAHLRRVAGDAGLRHVYTQQARDSEGGTTFCAACQAALIERDAGRIVRLDLGEDARCPYCRAPVAGYFAPLSRPEGLRHGALRLPVRLARR